LKLKKDLDKMLRILYVDSRLSDRSPNIEKEYYYYLQHELNEMGHFVDGLDPDGAFDYLREHSPDILVCEHVFYGDTEFVWGHEFIKEMQKRGYRIPPTIIFSESYFAGTEWDRAGVPYVDWISKIGEPKQKLLGSIKKIIGEEN
jgi:hypothetical protein